MDMRSKFLASTLAIGLGFATPMVSAIVFSDVVIAQTVEEKKKEADRLSQLGIQQFKIGEIEASIQFFKQSLDIYKTIGNKQGESYLLKLLSLTLIARGQYPQALEYLQPMLEIARSLKNQDDEKIALRFLGAAYIATSNYNKAIENLDQSLVISRKLEGSEIEALILNDLGMSYYYLSSYDRAINYYKQSLKIAVNFKYKETEAIILGNLGITSLSTGKYTDAINYLEQVLEISYQLKDKVLEGKTLGNLGLVYDATGNYGKAIKFYENALKISRDEDKRDGESKALGNLGNTYYSLGEYRKSITYHEQSLAISYEIKDFRGIGRSLGNLGNSYDALGDYKKAIEYREKHLEVARRIQDRQSEGQALGNLGKTYASIGDYKKAIDYHKQSLVIAYEIKNRVGEASAITNIGFSYDGLGDYIQAIEYYGKGLLIAREIKDRQGEYVSLNNLGATLSNQEVELAITFYKQSINIAESIRKDIRKLPRESQEIYTSTVARTYRNLADLFLTQGRIREAQAIFDLLKVQESSSYDEQEQTSIQFPLHPLEIQVWNQIEQQKLSFKTLESLGNRLKQNHDRITQDMNSQPIAIGNPNKLLNAKPNSLLIQNLVVGDRLWVIWTNAKGETKTIVQPITQKELTETVDRLRQALSTSSSDLKQLKATSQQLYNWLIPPALQTELTQNPNLHLFFSLDHVTRYIPIAALHDGKQYLIQTHTLSNLITTETDMTDRFSSPNGPANILALGTSNAVGGFSALPSVESELYAIVKTQNPDKGIYPGTIQLNEAFTANSLRTANSHRVLHIATHGSFNPKTINASYLLLGNGDKLPIPEIANLTTLSDKHLVVLSACETGLSGNSPDGTEISGISSYFLRRGAKSVLASLWLVNDPATALLMKNFYTQLAQPNISKAIALQTVQKQFLDRTLTDKDAKAIDRGARPYRPGQPPPDSFEHPYYWAPFILVGNSL
jgi:CHAT domain-containing protein/Flp pilus assembly protein TadD